MSEELPEESPSNEPQNSENSNTMKFFPIHTKRYERKLKDYLFEFIMLFLAISGGFFMENLRESYVDDRNEKQYISSLIRDIQEDTDSIQDVIGKNETQIKGIDSLLNYLDKSGLESDLSRFYFMTNEYLSLFHGFSVREVTITQLRNSGGLRLIDTNSVSDSIVVYYGAYNSHIDQQKFEIQLLNQILELKLKMLDYSTYRISNKKLTVDNSHMKEFYNRVLAFRSMLSYEVGWLKNYNKMGVSLLQFLKQEYKV